MVVCVIVFTYIAVTSCHVGWSLGFALISCDGDDFRKFILGNRRPNKIQRALMCSNKEGIFRQINKRTVVYDEKRASHAITLGLRA